MSLRAKLLVGWFRLIRENRTWNDLNKLEREIHRNQRPRNRRVPRRLRRRYHIEQFEIDGYPGFPCYTLRRPSPTPCPWSARSTNGHQPINPNRDGC